MSELTKNNKNITTLGYSGAVDITYVSRDKTFKTHTHNAGTSALMKAFCKFLSGNADRTVDVPQYLDLRYRETAESEWVRCFSLDIPLSGKKYEFDDDLSNWVARYTAVINYSVISKNITEYDTGEYRLYLFSRTADQTVIDYAYLTAEARDLARISPGTQAMIEWTTQVQNVS